MTKPFAKLAVVLFCLPLLVACSQEGTPYTEKTAEIDPALNTTHTSADADKADPDMPDQDDTQAPPNPPEKVTLTDDEWRAILSKEEFYVLRRSGTELPGTHKYNNHPLDKKGAFHCVGCGNKLYDAKHKFHSGCGWPSFNQEVEFGAITTHVDKSIYPYRTEMRCARCDGHLGHIFEDGHLWDQKTGLRHCVNGTALIFVPKGADPKEVIAEHRKQNAGN